MTIRIAVLNLQFGVGTTRGYWQYLTTEWKYFLPHSLHRIEQAAEECRSELIDISIVTEISTSPLRAAMSQVEAFRNTSGAKYLYFFASATSKLWNEGNAIFTRYEVMGTRMHTLPGGVIPRVLGEVSIKIGDEVVTVFVAHLALGKKARMKQLEEIHAIVSNKKGPCILGGDFNEPNPRAFKKITGLGFTDISLLNFPSWKPKRALDHIFTRGFEVQDVRIPRGAEFSDHLPLVATLRLV